MSFLRPLSMLRSAAARPAVLSARKAHGQVRFATSDYGSGKGNPAGEKPQQQGENPSENVEHPGPPPPKVAQGQSSSSPNKDSNVGQNDKTKPTSSSPVPPTGKREFSTSAYQLKESKEPAVEQAKQNQPSKSEVKGAKPKILNANPPSGSEQSQEVKEHNEDMKRRAEQAHEQVSNEDAEKDKVPASFWKGKAQQKLDT